MEIKNRINAKRIINFSGHTGSIYALSLSPERPYIYTGGSDGMVIEWNEANPNEGRLVAKLTEPVYSIFFDSETNYLWIGAASGNLHIIDLQQKAELKLYTTHTKGIFDIKKWRGSIFVAGGDGSLSWYDVFKLDFEGKRQISDKSLRCLAIEPVKGLLAIGSSDTFIYIYDKELILVQPQIEAHQNSVFSLAFSDNGSLLFSGGRDAMLNIWRVSEGFARVNAIPAHNLHVHSIALNPHYPYMITSSMDKTIKIWDVNSFELLRVMDKMRHQAHVNSINKIAWLTKDKFVSISDDKNVMVWELEI